MKNLETEIQKIIERNKRVEIDKKWEVSFVRRVLIVVITFGGAFLFLHIIEAENPILGACVPAGAYLLSTFSFYPLRKVWEKFQK
ncbi:hypothetical protein K9L27_02380 [Candidatus Gracilibacteria bacterium]|nr:hypothetical protein [Candidatus Gracilibacteria bacterium]